MGIMLHVTHANLLFYRKFYNPSPDIRPILESTGNLIYAIRDSLCKGITRYNNIKIEFRTDVYKYLLVGKVRSCQERGEDDCTHKKTSMSSIFPVTASNATIQIKNVAAYSFL